MTRKERAIKNLKQMCSDGRYLGSGSYVPLEVLEDFNLAIQALEQEPRWIPVSEKLPESDEEYHTFLVTDNKGRVTLSEFYLSISDRKPYWSGMIDVKAWMPLPKPYEVESEE